MFLFHIVIDKSPGIKDQIPYNPWDFLRNIVGKQRPMYEDKTVEKDMVDCELALKNPWSIGRMHKIALENRQWNC